MHRQIALLLFVFFLSGSRGVAAIQPMLLKAGTFAVEQGTNVIHIAAQCLNVHLETPRLTNVFDHFSDGLKVTRTIGSEQQTVTLTEAVNRGWLTPKGQDSFSEIGIEVNPKEVEKGATFQVEVKPDAPQFVATGRSQVDDVEKLLGKGGNVIQNADQTVERFISDQLPQWRSFFGDSLWPEVRKLFAIRSHVDPDDPDQLRPWLKQHLVWASRDKQGDALHLVGREFGDAVGLP